MAIKLKAPTKKPKLNRTNIKSPIGKLDGGLGASAGKKFKSSTLSNQFANRPVLQAPKIDPAPKNTNPIAGVSNTLIETNTHERYKNKIKKAIIVTKIVYDVLIF